MVTDVKNGNGNVRKSLEIYKILDNPNFADICCRLEIFIF